MTMLDGLTLALDAASATGSVALLDAGRLVGEDRVAMRSRDEERLLPAALGVLRAHGAGARDLSRVVCGGGPGSFTSLRIAAAIAKGLATAGGGAFCTVPSLALVVAGASPALAPGRYLVTLDAMRDERYALGVTVHEEGTISPDRDHLLVGVAEAARRASEGGAILVGPGEGDGLEPHARGVALLSSHVVPASLDGWEPDYGRLAEAQVQWESRHGRALPRA